MENMENIIRNAFKSLDEFTDIKIESIKLTEDIEDEVKLIDVESEDASVMNYLESTGSYISSYDFNVDGKKYSLFIEALTEDGESCDVIFDEFEKDNIKGFLVEVIDEEGDFIESLGDIVSGDGYSVDEVSISELVREATSHINGEEVEKVTDEEDVDFLGDDEEFVEVEETEESGHSLKKDSDLEESVLTEELDNSIIAGFREAGVEDGDISDETYDWGTYISYTEDPEDDYERFMNFVMENTEMVSYNSDWYSPCKVTEFMLKYIDAFTKFFEEENGEAYRPSSYPGTDWANDETFYDVFLTSLESLLIGNYSEEDYSKLVAYLNDQNIEPMEIEEEPLTESRPDKEEFLELNSGRKTKLQKRIDSGEITLDDAVAEVEKKWRKSEPGSADYLVKWLKDDNLKEECEKDVECGHCKRKEIKESKDGEDKVLEVVKAVLKSLPPKDKRNKEVFMWKINSKAADGEITIEDAEYIEKNADELISTILTEKIKERKSSRRLKEENEYPINDIDKMKEAEEVLNSEEEEGVEQIVDINAETIDDLEKTYIGSAILQCDTCKTMIYKDPADLVKVEGGDLYNAEEECPHCGSKDGYELIGQVATLDTDPEAVQEPPMEVESEVEVTDVEPAEEVEFEPVEVEPAVEETTDVEEVEPADVEEVSTEEEEEFPELNLESLKEDASRCWGVYQEVDNYYYKHHPDLIIGFIKKGLTKEEAEAQVKELEGREGCHYSVKKVKDCTDEMEEDLVESIDYDRFDSLAKRYLKEVYSNVSSYHTTNTTNTDSGLVIEGIIKFKNGKENKTSFIFETCTITKRGKARLVGYNETFSAAKKAFTLLGVLNNDKLLSESMTYNYTIKQLNESKKVYGRVVTPKRFID